MSESVKRTKIKDSPKQSRHADEKIKREVDSKLPKVRHKEKKSPALNEGHLEKLTEAFNGLCHPLDNAEQRVSDWLEVNVRKDSKIKKQEVKDWLKDYTEAEAFPDVVGFKASQFLAALAAQKFDESKRTLYTNALLVSQSAFSSVQSYQAACDVMEKIGKGVVRSTDQLVYDLQNAGSLNRQKLGEALKDVGIHSSVIKGLLDVALAVQEPGMDREELAHQAAQLEFLFGRLGKRSQNPARYSAPTGTIDTGTGARNKREKTSVTFPEQVFKGQPPAASGTETPAGSAKLANRQKSTADTSDDAKPSRTEEFADDKRSERKHKRQESSSESRSKKDRTEGRKDEKRSERKHKRQESRQPEDKPDVSNPPASASATSAYSLRPLPNPQSPTGTNTVSRSTSGTEEQNSPRGKAEGPPVTPRSLTGVGSQPLADPALLAKLTAQFDKPGKPKQHTS